MEILPLFQQILSLFLMMGLGFAVVKLGLLQSEDSRILSLICIYIITPCVNINAFQIAYSPDILQGFLFAVILSVCLHLLLFLLSGILKKRMHLTPVERLSIVYPNAGNLVIPLVSALFGSQWVIYSSAFMSVELFCIWTHGQSVISGQRSFQFRKIFTNVNLICVVAGLVLFLLRIQLPQVIRTTVSSVSSMLGPASMIMIGMMIAGMPLTQILHNGRVYLVAALRLVVAPLAAIVVLSLAGNFLSVPNAHTIMTIVLLAVIMPASSTITQLAQLYQSEPEHCGAINVITTLLSMVTMPLMIALWNLLS